MVPSNVRSLINTIREVDRHLERVGKLQVLRRNRLEKLMKKLGRKRLSTSTSEALRYLSVEYKVDADKLLAQIKHLPAVLNHLMPRTPRAAKIAACIRREEHPDLSADVRKCCKRKTQWKVKIDDLRKQVKVKKAS